MTILVPVVRGKDILHTLKQHRIEERRMRAFVRGIAPLVGPNVKRIL
jgi:hypothetical protein